MFSAILYFKGGIKLHTSKTHSGAKKRFRVTAKGKILRSHANKNHILNKKTRKRKRHLRKTSLVHCSDRGRVARMLLLKTKN